jgi:hypothetical protein
LLTKSKIVRIQTQIQTPTLSNMFSIKTIIRLFVVVTALLAAGAKDPATSVRGRANAIIAEAQNRDLQDQEHRALAGGGIHDLISEILDIAQGATEFATRVAIFCFQNGADGGAIQEFCDEAL